MFQSGFAATEDNCVASLFGPLQGAFSVGYAEDLNVACHRSFWHIAVCTFIFASQKFTLNRRLGMIHNIRV